MGTNTIQGYEADPDQVQARVAAALADIRAGIDNLTDPLDRYTALSKQQVLAVAVLRALEPEIIAERGVELHRMAADLAYEDVAAATLLGSPQRVAQIIAAARKRRNLPRRTRQRSVHSSLHSKRSVRTCPGGVNPGR